MPRLCTCRCLTDATTFKVGVKDFRVKMWIGQSINYFTEKYRMERKIFAEYFSAYTATEHFRTSSQEPVRLEEEDEEMVWLKKKHSALTTKKYSNEDAAKALEQIIQSRPKEKRFTPPFFPRSIYIMTPKPINKRIVNVERRIEYIRSSASPRKPPVNFYALPETAMKYKYNQPWEKKKTVRRLVTTADNSFVVVRT
mmetsp:Transcript_27313/g.49124  ORF Transcript_27313/g.49124 Transcript_27313/m.49124 type:complete len:197 (+) Transcript_27313:74-664(+)